MAMTKEALLTNARNDGSGRGIAGRARNDAEERDRIAGRARNDVRVTKAIMVYMLQYNWIQLSLSVQTLQKRLMIHYLANFRKDDLLGVILLALGIRGGAIADHHNPVALVVC